MMPIVFINSRSVPFVDMIITGEKVYETRSRDVLRKFSESGHRFLIAETGNSRPIIRCSARIRSVLTITDAETWNKYRPFHAVPVDSEYDWKPETKKKVLYELSGVMPVAPFVPEEGKRHGRTWMEYAGKKEGAAK